MPFQPSQRALDFMRCVLPEQRRYFRVHLPVQAIVTFRDASTEPQMAFLRDINMLGAFFYCRQKPKVGQVLRLELALPEQSEPCKAICEGHVLRVEEFGPEAAVGVAMEFTSYELSRPSPMEQASQQPQGPSFIGWTVEMVERIFEKSSRFVRLNPECEHAA